jgi:hypothetical protein
MRLVVMICVVFIIIIICAGCRDSELGLNYTVDGFSEAVDYTDNEIDDPNCDGYRYSVSIFNLLTNPEKYVNKRVVVKGYLSYKTDDISIYPTKELYEASLLESRIRLSPGDRLAVLCDMLLLTKDYVSLEGIFRRDNRSVKKSKYICCAVSDQYVLEVEDISQWRNSRLNIGDYKEEYNLDIYWCRHNVWKFIIH